MPTSESASVPRHPFVIAPPLSAEASSFKPTHTYFRRAVSVPGRVLRAGVRNLVFRPRLAVESFAALNVAILAELEADLSTRHLDDGRSAYEALTLERQLPPAAMRRASLRMAIHGLGR